MRALQLLVALTRARLVVVGATGGNVNGRAKQRWEAPKLLAESVRFAGAHLDGHIRLQVRLLVALRERLGLEGAPIDRDDRPQPLAGRSAGLHDGQARDRGHDDEGQVGRGQRRRGVNEQRPQL